ncbi:MAG TPA: sigma 54-interacting transcriptional regulator, partial [Polyangiaceae bacterium]|nr:sigma 54-interacting transcriptional regulator [Polyangiaceae bacterium]
MRLLIIDDEVSLRENVARYFTLKGYEVAQAGDGESGLASLRAQAADVVLLDLRLPDRSGLEVLEAIKQQSPATGVIMLTGYGDVEVAVQALQMRADHFLLKPTKLEALDAVIARVAANYARQTALDYLQSRTAPTCGGDNRYVLPNGLLEQVRLLAGSPGTTVLLQGETGTGKGMVASLIHDLGPRRGAPFVDLNCAGLSGTLLESDLFGHERGAFTDAKTMKRGLFEIAAGGSVFLDEIGEMPIDVQAKVL